MGQDPLVSLLTIAAVTAAMAAVLGLILYWGVVREHTLRAARRIGLLPAPPPLPAGHPLERIAADARRLRRQLQQTPSGLPVARLEGWRMAYDDVLTAGCLALGIDHELDSLHRGYARDAERLRVEVCLERAGLRITGAA